MAFKAIMRGVGAAAESVGKGLAAIDVERKKQKQIEIQNKFQEDLIYLQEQEAAFQETKLETEEYLAGNQIEHERTQAQLDRVFEERLAIDQRTHEVATAALLVTTDRKGRELLEGLKQETMERKVLFEMLSDLSLLESGVYIENAENIFTILGASPGPDASAEDHAKWDAQKERAIDDLRTALQTVRERGLTRGGQVTPPPGDETKPIPTPDEEVAFNKLLDLTPEQQRKAVGDQVQAGDITHQEGVAMLSRLKLQTDLSFLSDAAGNIMKTVSHFPTAVHPIIGKLKAVTPKVGK